MGQAESTEWLNKYAAMQAADQQKQEHRLRQLEAKLDKLEDMETQLDKMRIQEEYQRTMHNIQIRRMRKRLELSRIGREGLDDDHYKILQ